jgi:hypothetical protein
MIENVLMYDKLNSFVVTVTNEVGNVGLFWGVGYVVTLCFTYVSAAL